MLKHKVVRAPWVEICVHRACAGDHSPRPATRAGDANDTRGSILTQGKISAFELHPRTLGISIRSKFWHW
jgi:hypothetical protein